MDDTINTREVIEEISSRHYNVRDEFKDNTVEENKEFCRQDSLSFGVGALSITGDLNIGIMIRTASLLGAQDFFIFGRRKYDRRSTVGAENYIDVHRLPMSPEDLENACKMYDYFPVFVEHGGQELPFSYGDWERFSDEREYANPLFIFGTESDGIPNEFLDYFSVYNYPMLSLPQRGVLRSFNVSTSMAIVCWDYVSKYGGV